MKNLSVQKLRKIILEELQNMMLNDDVLFSLDQLPMSGTGKVKYDSDDMLYPYDDEEESEDDIHGSCSKCGGHHGADTPCGHHSGGHDSHDGVDDIVNKIISLLN